MRAPVAQRFHRRAIEQFGERSREAVVDASAREGHRVEAGRRPGQRGYDGSADFCRTLSRSARLPPNSRTLAASFMTIASSTTAT